MICAHEREQYHRFICLSTWFPVNKTGKDQEVCPGQRRWFQKTHATPWELSLPHDCVSRCELSVTAPMRCFPDCIHAAHHDHQDLQPSVTVSPKSALPSINCYSQGAFSQKQKNNQDRVLPSCTVGKLKAITTVFITMSLNLWAKNALWWWWGGLKDPFTGVA